MRSGLSSGGLGQGLARSSYATPTHHRGPWLGASNATALFLKTQTSAHTRRYQAAHLLSLYAPPLPPPPPPLGFERYSGVWVAAGPVPTALPGAWEPHVTALQTCLIRSAEQALL